MKEVRLSPWATEEEIDEVHTWVKAKSFTCPVSLIRFGQSAHADVGTIQETSVIDLNWSKCSDLVPINRIAPISGIRSSDRPTGSYHFGNIPVRLDPAVPVPVTHTVLGRDSSFLGQVAHSPIQPSGLSFANR